MIPVNYVHSTINPVAKKLFFTTSPNLRQEGGRGGSTYIN